MKKFWEKIIQKFQMWKLKREIEQSLKDYKEGKFRTFEEFWKDYYQNRTPKEIQEDKEWVEFATKQFEEIQKGEID